MQPERRKDRRLAVRLPVECRLAGTVQVFRSSTRDISTGGVRFDLDLPEDLPRPDVSTLLELTVTVPPGSGHSPYTGRVSGPAEVVRCDCGDRPEAGRQSYHVAARFKQPLQLRF